MIAFYKRLLKTLLLINKGLDNSGSTPIPVLMYHGVVPDEFPMEAWTLIKESNFRSQMDILKACYDVTNIAEAYKSLGKKSRGKPKAVVTFDDGYRNLYQCAYPTLGEYNIPATIFLVTDYCDRQRLFWFDKIILAIQRRSRLSKDGTETIQAGAGLNGGSNVRWEHTQHILEYLKKLSDNDREIISDRLFAQIKLDESIFENLYVLKADQIQKMTNSGLIKIGSHTHNHELLDKLPPDQATDSIRSSLDILNRMTGNSCHLFAYPNGNYNKETLSILESLGIFAAFTTRNGRWTFKESQFEIPRISIGSYDSLFEFVLKISGFHSRMKSLKKILIR